MNDSNLEKINEQLKKYGKMAKRSSLNGYYNLGKIGQTSFNESEIMTESQLIKKIDDLYWKHG